MEPRLKGLSTRWNCRIALLVLISTNQCQERFLGVFCWFSFFFFLFIFVFCFWFCLSPSSHIYNICRINTIITILRLLLLQDICRTCTLALHLRLESSIVRASHRSSEGCGFDPRLGLGNCFSGVRAWRTFIYHIRYLYKLPNLHLSQCQKS